MKLFRFLPSVHIVVVRAISGDKENWKRKLLSELLAWLYTSHHVCHMSIQSTKTYLLVANIIFLGKRNKPLSPANFLGFYCCFQGVI